MLLDKIPTQQAVSYRYAVVYRPFRLNADATPHYAVFDTLPEAYDFQRSLYRYTTYNGIFRLNHDEVMTNDKAWEAYHTSPREVAA